MRAAPDSVVPINRDGGSGRRSGNARSGRSTSGGEHASRIVQETFAGYARRGIFRAYGDRSAPRGQTHFSFRWHTDVPLNVVYHAGNHELIFRDLLPGMEGNSEMYRHLKQFLSTRTSQAVPVHRRIDPRKAALRLRQRSGTVSLVVSLTESNLEYGVRKAVNLIHELFVSFLRDPLYFSYMVQHFGLDPDM